MSKNTKKDFEQRHNLEHLEERILLSADPLLVPLASIESTNSDLVSVALPTEQNQSSAADDGSLLSLESQPLSHLADPNDNVAIDGQFVDNNAEVITVESGQQLTGNGQLQGHLISQGVMGPGNSPGVVQVASVEYTSSSELIIEIGGTSEGEYDQVKVDGLAQLDGKLTIKVIDGYQLEDGDTFSIISYSSVEGQFVSADGLFALDGDGSGYFQITQTESGIELRYRKLGNDLKISFTTTESANAFGEQLNSHYFKNTSASVQDQAVVEFADFIYFQGSIKIDAAEATGITVATGFAENLGLPSELTIDRTYLTISVTNASGFIGYGGPPQIDRNFDGDFDDEGETNSNAKGLTFENASFGMAYFNLPAGFLDLDIALPDLPALPNLESELADSLPNFYALKAEIDAFELVGFDALFSLSAEKMVISINGSSSWLPASSPAIDFKTSFGPLGLSIPVADGADPILLGFGGSQITQATLINARMSLLDFVHIYGDLSFEKGRTANVNVVTGLASDLDGLLTDVLDGDDPSSISGLEVGGFSIAGTNLKAFAGINGGFDVDGNLIHNNATGLLLDGVTFAYLDLTPTRPDLSTIMNFTAITATAQQVEVIGIDGLTVEASDIRIVVNTGKAWPGNVGTPVIDFQSSFPAEATDTDGDGKIDPAGYELLVGQQSLYLDHEGSELIAASLNDAKINVVDFVAALGSFSFRKGATHTVTVKDNSGSDQTQSVEVESLQIGGQGITVFAGIGDLGFVDGDDLNLGATGILLENVDFAYASFTPTAAGASVLNASFQALSVSADSGKFIGLGSDVVEFTNVAIGLNTGKLFSNTLVTPSIDFQNSNFGDPSGYAVSTSSNPDDKVYLNFADHQQLITASGELDLAGIIQIDGDFGFSKVKAVDVEVKSNLQQWGAPDEFSLSGPIDALAISVTNATVKVDLGVVKTELNNANVGLFIGTSTLASIVPEAKQFVPKFIAIKASTNDASFETGIDGANVISITSEGTLELEANFTYFPKLDPNTQAAIFALGAPAIDFTSSFGESGYLLPAVGNNDPIAMDFSSQVFNLLIEEATIDILMPGTNTSVISISGGVGLSRLSAQTVTLTDGTTIDGMQGLSLVGKGLTASVNLGGFDLDLGAEAELGLVLLSDLNDLAEPDFYVAMTSQLDTEKLDEIPVVDIPGVGFELKGAELNINTKLNRDFSEGINVPTVDFAKSYQGEKAAGVDLNGNGRIDQSGLILVTTRDNTVDSAALINFSDQLLGLRGQAIFTVTALGIRLEGAIELQNAGDTTQILFDGTLNIAYGANSALNFNAKGLLYSKVVVDPEQPDTITDQEFAIRLETQGGFDLPGVISLDGELTFVLNTSGKKIEFDVHDDFKKSLGYDTVVIEASPENSSPNLRSIDPYFSLQADDVTLTLLDQFSLDSSVLIVGSLSGLTLGVDGTIGLFGLGSLGAKGDIYLGDNGIKTDLNLSVVDEDQDGIVIFELITITGEMNFSLDSTQGDPVITVGVTDTGVQFWTLFTLKPGDLLFTYKDGIFSVDDFSASVDLVLLKTTVTVDHLKSNGDFSFAFALEVGLDQSFGPIYVDAGADATLTLAHSSGEFDLDADLEVKATVGIKAVKISVFGKKITIVPAFDKTATFKTGLDLSFDPSDGELSIGADLFGKIDVSIPIGFKLPLPDAPPPNVAAKSGNTINVHVGQLAHNRNYDQEVTDETIRIRQIGDHTLVVDVEGKITKIETLDANDIIRIDGGSGLDKIIIDSSVTADIELLNIENVSYSGRGHAIITGTNDNDTIKINGNGTAIINSGDGEDTIVINDAQQTTINAGSGNDSITLYGLGSHTLTPGQGDDTIETYMGGSSLIIKLEQGFGNDRIGGNGKISQLDMSQIQSDIHLEYDYQLSKFSMHSNAGTLSLISSNTPQIERIDFGSGNDTYVITSPSDDSQVEQIEEAEGSDDTPVSGAAAFDITLTDNGGTNTFYYVDRISGSAVFSGNRFTLNGVTITFDTSINQLYFGNIDYSVHRESGRFAGISNVRIGDESNTLTLTNTSALYQLNDTRFSLYADSLTLSDNFSAAEWAISTRLNALFEADLTATSGDIFVSQTNAAGRTTVSGDLTARQGLIDFSLAGNFEQRLGTIAAQSGGKTVRIHSTNGTISQLDGTGISANNGDIELQSHGDSFIANIDAGSGRVTLTSQTGGIYDAGDADKDFQADEVVFTAFSGFGQNTNAFETEINRISGTVTDDGSISFQNSQGLEFINSGLSVQGDGHILVQNQQGDLIANSTVQVAGDGNIRLESLNGSLAVNANITNQSTRSVSLLARQNITQQAGTTISAENGGDIDLYAELGSVSQADGALVTSGSNGNIRVEAGRSMTVAAMAAGNISLTAGSGSITDGGDLRKDLDASQLRLQAGTGIGSGDRLEIATDKLVVRTGSGGVFLLEDDDIVIDTLSAIMVNRVALDGTTEVVTDASLSDVITTDNGSVDLETIDGSLWINDGLQLDDRIGISANGTGDIRLHINGTGQDVIVQSDTVVTTERGSIVITAADSIVLQDRTDVTISQSALYQSLSLMAETGNITQVDTSHISSIDSDINLTAYRTIDIANISAPQAKVTMVAETGGIYDVGETDIDIIADELTFRAQQAFGTNDNDIDTELAGVSGVVTEGTINIQEQSDLDVLSNGLSVLGSGNILVTNKASDILILGDVAIGDAGNILLKSDSGSLAIGADIQTNSGQFITLQAYSDIDLQSVAQITTRANGTIDLLAEQGSIRQVDGSILLTEQTGIIRLHAADSIALAAMNAGAGDASLITQTGSVTDSGDTHTDIVASQLRVQAGTGAGNGNALETAVETFAGRAGSGGLHIHEDDDIEINTLSDIAIQRVQLNGSTQQVTDAAISDLRTEENGSISVRTKEGTLSVYDGLIPDDGVGIYAQGSGSITLEAYGSGHDIKIKENTDIVSDNGDISILGDDAVLQEAGADLRIGRDGNIRVQTLNGSIYMTDGTVSETHGSGNIVYRAKQHIDLSLLSAQAHTTVIAEMGQIRDNLQIGEGAVDYDSKIDPGNARPVNSLHTTVVLNGAEYYGTFKIGQLFNERSNIVSVSLSIIANQGIGILGVQDIDTDVAQLEMVNKSENHVFVQEQDSVNVFGQGARNINSDGNLMFSTITGELYIDNKNIRDRDPTYSTDRQRVPGYTIDGYTLNDFYLEEGIRIVNGLVHAGREGYLYVRSAIGDWGPMNYDQLADELSRNWNTDFEKKGKPVFIVQNGSDNNLESEEGTDTQSTQDALESYLFAQSAPETLDIDAINLTEAFSTPSGSHNTEISELLELYLNQITDREVTPEASTIPDADQEIPEDAAENYDLQDHAVTVFLQAIEAMFGDQPLTQEEMYNIYVNTMTAQGVKAVDFQTFSGLIQTVQN